MYINILKKNQMNLKTKRINSKNKLIVKSTELLIFMKLKTIDKKNSSKKI